MGANTHNTHKQARVGLQADETKLTRTHDKELSTMKYGFALLTNHWAPSVLASLFRFSSSASLHLETLDQ